jgi:hypothetical protein
MFLLIKSIHTDRHIYIDLLYFYIYTYIYHVQYACMYVYTHIYIHTGVHETDAHKFAPPPPHTHTHSLIATSAGVYLVAYQSEPPAKHEAVSTRAGGGGSDEFQDVLDDDLEALL